MAHGPGFEQERAAKQAAQKAAQAALKADPNGKSHSHSLRPTRPSDIPRVGG